MRKLLIIATTAICFIGLVFVFSSNTRDENPDPTPITHTISAHEAHALMDELDDLIILDVRAKEEFSEKHIPNALLIPLDELLYRTTSELPNKSAPIFIYCQSGTRSAYAALALAELGYENIFDLGGLDYWPFDTTTSEQ